MTQHYILSNLFLILVDFLVVSNLRRFILDFLIGARNRKSAKNIHNEQTRRNRVMLSYMEPYTSVKESATKGVYTEIGRTLFQKNRTANVMRTDSPLMPKH